MGGQQAVKNFSKRSHGVSVGKGITLRAAATGLAALLLILAVTYWVVQYENKLAADRGLAAAESYFLNRKDLIESHWAAEVERFRNRVAVSSVLTESQSLALQARFVQFATSYFPLSDFTHAVLLDSDGVALAKYRTRSQQELVIPSGDGTDPVWVFGNADSTLYRVFTLQVRLRDGAGFVLLYAPLDAGLLGSRHAYPNSSVVLKWHLRPVARFVHPLMPPEAAGVDANWRRSTLRWGVGADAPEMEVSVWTPPTLPMTWLLLIAAAMFLLSAILGWLVLGRWLAQEVSGPISVLSRSLSEWGMTKGEWLPVPEVGVAEVRLIASAINEAVSARRKYEKRAIEMGALYQDLVETSVDLIWKVDAMARFTYVNPVWKKALGYTSKEMIGRPMADFQLADVAIDLASILEQLRGEESRSGIRSSVVGKDGQVHELIMNLKSLKDENGVFAGSQGSAYDITDQRKAEARLLEAQRLEFLGDLAGGVAHDFNNQLGVILGNLDELEHRLLPGQESRSAHAAALKAVLKSQEVLRSLLLLSGRQHLEMIREDLSVFVEEMLPILRDTAGEDIALDLQFPDQRAFVLLDRATMGQLITQLVSNARDAVRESDGEPAIVIRIEIRRIAHNADLTLKEGDYVVVRVSDTGRGMDAATQLRAFDPYFSTKHRADGAGLGLPVVYAYATQLGGTARLESTLGEGTEVSVFFPYAAHTADAR